MASVSAADEAGNARDVMARLADRLMKGNTGTALSTMAPAQAHATPRATPRPQTSVSLADGQTTPAAKAVPPATAKENLPPPPTPFTVTSTLSKSANPQLDAIMADLPGGPSLKGNADQLAAAREFLQDATHGRQKGSSSRRRVASRPSSKISSSSSRSSMAGGLARRGAYPPPSTTPRNKRDTRSQTGSFSNSSSSANSHFETEPVQAKPTSSLSRSPFSESTFAPPAARAWNSFASNPTAPAQKEDKAIEDVTKSMGEMDATQGTAGTAPPNRINGANKPDSAWHLADITRTLQERAVDAIPPPHLRAKAQAGVFKPTANAAAGPFTVMVQNCPPDFTAEEMGKVFSDRCGPITTCKLVASGPTFIAEVTFMYKAVGEKMIETFNGAKVDGRSLYVYWKSGGANQTSAAPAQPFSSIEKDKTPASVNGFGSSLYASKFADSAPSAKAPETKAFPITSTNTKAAPNGTSTPTDSVTAASNGTTITTNGTTSGINGVTFNTRGTTPATNGSTSAINGYSFNSPSVTTAKLPTNEDKMLQALNNIQDGLAQVIKRVGAIEEDQFTLQKQMETLLQAEERRKFLGTNSAKEPFAIMVHLPHDISKVQVNAELKVSDLVRRIRAQVGITPKASKNPRITVDGIEVGHMMTLGEVGVMKDKDPVVFFNYDRGD